MRIIPISIFILLIFGCEKESNPPVALLEIYPTTGDSTTLFEINSSESFDDNSLDPSLEFRWDFDNNGIWDTEFEKNPVTLQYFAIPSTYHIKVQVRDQDGLTSITTDSINVFGQNPDVSILIDSRDGKVYRIVKIGKRWWMAENLRFGNPIDHWTQAQKDNQITETYCWQGSLDNQVYHVYSWHEAMNHNHDDLQGICPVGWHLPTKIEWESLYDEMPIFFATEYFGKNGLSSLNLDQGKRLLINRKEKIVDESTSEAGYWSAENFLTYEDVLIVHFGSFSPIHIRLAMIEETYLDFDDIVQIVNTVRCIKNIE